jgi:nicotinate-nucleotide--dimethylbenzimidazole phosphoribosyltransferase
MLQSTDTSPDIAHAPHPWFAHPRFPGACAAVDSKTKPLGALGRIESLAVQLACLQDTLTPHVERARALVFAADHGVADEGVSAYPKAVTREMMRNFAAGGAAICVFARSVGAELEVIDVGVDADMSDVTGIVHASVRRGTRNFRHEPAMTADECAAAMRVGRDAAQRAIDAGMHAVLLGEMGIGNTTSAAALTSAITGAEPALTVGRGTGIEYTRLQHKVRVVSETLALHVAASLSTERMLAAIGGLEIAAMCGAALHAAQHGIVVIVDGYIATAAVLVAYRIDAGARRAFVFAHRGAEPGHAVALAALNAEPLLALELRLGEGSGAALALPLVRAAARMMTEMATFADAGVSGADPA